MRVCSQFSRTCGICAKDVQAEELRLLAALQWKLHGPTAFELGIELQRLLRHHLLGPPPSNAAAGGGAGGGYPDEPPLVLHSVESFVAVVLDLALLDEHYLRFPATAVALAAMKVRHSTSSSWLAPLGFLLAVPPLGTEGTRRVRSEYHHVAGLAWTCFGPIGTSRRPSHPPPPLSHLAGCRARCTDCLPVFRHRRGRILRVPAQGGALGACVQPVLR